LRAKIIGTSLNEAGKPFLPEEIEKLMIREEKPL
jgi:hypothetical protein